VTAPSFGADLSTHDLTHACEGASAPASWARAPMMGRRTPSARNFGTVLGALLGDPEDSLSGTIGSRKFANFGWRFPNPLIYWRPPADTNSPRFVNSSSRQRFTCAAGAGALRRVPPEAAHKKRRVPRTVRRHHRSFRSTTGLRQPHRDVRDGTHGNVGRALAAQNRPSPRRRRSSLRIVIGRSAERWTLIPGRRSPRSRWLANVISRAHHSRRASNQEIGHAREAPR
jgi:hypothetical protein